MNYRALKKAGEPVAPTCKISACVVAPALSLVTGWIFQAEKRHFSQRHDIGHTRDCSRIEERDYRIACFPQTTNIAQCDSDDAGSRSGVGIALEADESRRTGDALALHGVPGGVVPTETLDGAVDGTAATGAATETRAIDIDGLAIKQPCATMPRKHGEKN